MLFTHHLDIYKWKKNVQDPGFLVEIYCAETLQEVSRCFAMCQICKKGVTALLDLSCSKHQPGVVRCTQSPHCPQFWGCSGLAEGQSHEKGRLKLQSWWENCILQLWMDSWSILPSLLIT